MIAIDRRHDQLREKATSQKMGSWHKNTIDTIDSPLKTSLCNWPNIFLNEWMTEWITELWIRSGTYEKDTSNLAQISETNLKESKW